MPRSRWFDRLQSYSFWLVDVQPGLIPPFYALLPVFQFASMTAPEVTVTTKEIVQATQSLSRKVVETATINEITLMRGATWLDSDFWTWTRNAIHGYDPNDRVRRTLLMIQFMSGSIFNFDGKGGKEADPLLATSLALFGAGLSTAVGLKAAGGSVEKGLAGASVAAALGAASLTGGIGGLQEWMPRVPVRSWLLEGCIPVRYKAATDFDATSGEISMMEMDLAVENLEEISLV
jgi:hypothetical protein